MSLTDEDRRRRLAAKRNNERVKLGATALNAIAIAIVSVAVVLPAISAPDLLLTGRAWILLLAAIVLHLVAHAALSFLRSED